ncbi:two-partner secretion domain-containing protein [Mastigocoleus testarum]|uniref:Filamentous haemagglutinin FhaB/tRNA nuclease CdiA-like TPS domain-containing protein n=1 Tax=Mastigocoleus testarum BC008 TaxID=371196 RepID=A0A0V7ZHX5_9CYAN|nr:filamentous hemagglutinin N-terminal domain-containing protein [Mastigocoleus testarum]KST63846.1 hypothetical protein BC008_15435 [Mastigocoleus testarum BC008]
MIYKINLQILKCLGYLGAFGLGFLQIIVFSGSKVSAQNIVPDNTLGNENSRVEVLNSGGSPVDRISGGAIRGKNLFHSFQEFNIGDGRTADFINPSNNIQNILTRVTGNNPSNILGILRVSNDGGVISNPNFFLINPNGIVFGENASLDVSGSFVGTTANALQFGEQGFFSASKPETPQLLTVNPSALFFNQVANQPVNSIESQAFLSVPTGKSLLLVGGNTFPSTTSTGKILLNGGRLRAPGGRIEIGGLGETGKINLNTIDNNFSLVFPEGVKRVDVSLLNLAEVDVTAGDGGDISIYGQNLNILDGSDICAGIGADPACGGVNQDNGSANAQAGDIKLDALGKITIANQVSEVSNNLNSNAIGNGGDINIKAKSTAIDDGGRISATNFGVGNVGNVNINSISTSVTNDSRIVSTTFGSGKSGDIVIETGNFIVENSQVGSSTFSSGKAGNLTVRASNFVELKGEVPPDEQIGFPGGLFSQVDRDGNGGQGGNLTIETKRLSVSDGSKIQAATFGRGNAGNIIIKAEEIDLFNTSLPNFFSTGIFAGVERDAREPNSAKGDGGNIAIETERLLMRGRTFISSDVDENATGNGGDINITTKSLFLIDDASILTLTQAQGDAGNIFINAHDIQLNTSVINSGIRPGGVGKGGDIDIETDFLSLLNGSQINSIIFRQSRDNQGNIIPSGKGDAGNIKINASEKITLSGVSRNGFSSALFTITEKGTSGSAGDIFVETDNLRITEGAIIGASTSNASDAGEISINAKNFEAVNGGQIVTATRDRGNAGEIILNVKENITLKGVDSNFQQRSEAAKKFILNNPSVRFQQVSDIIFNEGSASGIFANTASNSTGDGGIINLQGNSLSINDEAQITAQSQGLSKAGNININLRNSLIAENGEISTTSEQSSGGAIDIKGRNINLFGDSDIRTNVNSGEGGGGNINLTANTITALDDSDILSFANDGKGGDITFNTDGFFSSSQFLPASAIANRDNLNNLDLNDRVDVNASGTVSGNITGIPDTTFIQNSITELPENQIDTNALISQTCIARSSDTGSTFNVFGSSGFAEAPGHADISRYPTNNVRGIPKTTLRNWKKGDPIIEPDGVYRLPDGKIVLSRNCS